MNMNAASLFSRVILSERTVQIKLLGDSITHGVGGTGFAQNGEPIVEGFARNPDGFCWAKRFKEYMQEHFDCRVINNGCTGTTIEFVLEHFDTLVDASDDIVICTIGTNNRHQYYSQGPKWDVQSHKQTIYRNILALHKKFRDAGKQVIFMANIPAAASNEQDAPGEDGYWRLIHMNDIHDLYVKASFACDFPLIPMYTLFQEYCELRGIPLDSLLADGLHPNDAGYEVMFRLILKELGIARAVE